MRMLLGVCVALLLAVGPSFADKLEGRYRIEGVEPDGRPYEGALAVKRIGETYVVVWSVGGRRFIGTALGAPSGFAVSFRHGESSGVAIFRPTEEGYQGAFAYHLNARAGQERWIRSEQDGE